MKASIGVGILGGTGYGAAELLRLLHGHPRVSVRSIVSNSSAGEKVSTFHPQLRSFYDDLTFDSELRLDSFSHYESKVVFSALPHGKSAEVISKLASREDVKNLCVKFIDLSGDFRLKNAQERAKHYPEVVTHAKLNQKFAYGLTEKNRKEITSANFVANPGCLASACALAVLPLIGETFRGKVVFDAKTGSSGGGRSLAETMHHPYRHANMNAYKILEHRHEPEIREALGDVMGDRVETVFVPHLLPISRGILATAYVQLPEEVPQEKLFQRYDDFYKDSAFIRVRHTPPDLSSVVGSNFCDVAIFSRGREVVAISALDNLVKGMAGQAIQNMNLMCRAEETEGLWQPSLALM